MPERAEAAVAILRDESGFAELRRTSGGLEVREHNCVFQRVAEGLEEICTFHTEYVSKLMGAPVALEAVNATAPTPAAPWSGGADLTTPRRGPCPIARPSAGRDLPAGRCRSSSPAVCISAPIRQGAAR